MWPDKEAEIDYLNFGYMIDIVVDIATNRELSPSTIGLYGDWGSGKSSLMKLAQKKIEERNPKSRKGKDKVKTLCIEFNGWLFEGYEDTKTSLCGAILDALADEKLFSKEVTDYAKELIRKIDFNRILGKGIKYGLDLFLTGGLGALTDFSIRNLLSIAKANAGEAQTKDIEGILNKFKKSDKTCKEIKNFRNEFKELLDKSQVENLVVFIDELDRCLPDTVLEVFEAMRLFLFVDGMSFVIGADERLIQYSIKSKYKEVPGNNMDIGKEYLEKVIQYPLCIPQLTQAEVNQYLACLLLRQTLTDEDFKKILDIVYSLEPDQDFSMELINNTASDIAESCKNDMALAWQIEVFAVIENTSTMNVEVLRAYTEFCMKVGMIEEALKKLMEQPANKYNAIAYGQLAPFIAKLSPDETKKFNDYLSTNEDVKGTIERQAKLQSIMSSSKK